MRKVIGTGVLALLLIFGLTMSQAEATWYWFQVRDEIGRPVTSGFTCHILTTATVAHDVVYAETAYTNQRTNPVVPDSNGVCQFATSNTTVDVAIWGTSGSAKGATAKVSALTDVSHVVILNTNMPTKHLRFFWDRAISKGGEIDTGIDLPKGALVDDVWVEVATGAARMSVSVGLLSTEASGDADGFCASQGADFTFVPQIFHRCQGSRTAFLQVAPYAGFYWMSNTRGELLAAYGKGKVDSNAYAASQGLYIEFPHQIREGGARSITYTTNDVAGAAGYVHLFYRELRMR